MAQKFMLLLLTETCAREISADAVVRLCCNIRYHTKLAFRQLQWMYNMCKGNNLLTKIHNHKGQSQ